MSITDKKHKIKFDEENKAYILYRLLEKSEIQAHLNNAQQQIDNLTLVKENFQSYLDDSRVVEVKENEVDK